MAQITKTIMFVGTVLLGGFFMSAHAKQCFSKFEIAASKPNDSTVKEMKGEDAKVYSLNSIHKSHDDLIIIEREGFAYVFIFENGQSCQAFINDPLAHERATEAVKKSKGI